MNTQLQHIRSQLRYDGRGIVSEYVIRMIKGLWDQVGWLGYGIAVIVLFFVVNFTFDLVFGTTSGAFGADGTSAVALLVAVGYTSWIGFLTYEEYTERHLSRTIRERPSIATVNDALGLLQSKDHEAKVNASFCLSVVVSVSPKNVVNTIDAPTEDIVEYLLPFLNDGDETISENIADVIAFMARDYPLSVKPYQSVILDYIQEGTLTDDARGDLALAVGFLTLSEEADTNDELQSTALQLCEDEHPDVRIGACYILAGFRTQETRQRLQEMARNDPEQEVREHAEELV